MDSTKIYQKIQQGGGYRGVFLGKNYQFINSKTSRHSFFFS